MNTYIFKANAFTETKKHSPNTGACANNTLHKYLSHPIGEPARQSACKARPLARHVPLATHVAAVGLRVNPCMFGLTLCVVVCGVVLVVCLCHVFDKRSRECG